MNERTFDRLECRGIFTLNFLNADNFRILLCSVRACIIYLQATIGKQLFVLMMRYALFILL